jgi:hypothetical protein
MNILKVTKDGGAESTVWAYWLIELKWLGSIALLRFENGSRDAYHSHAFDSVSWLLAGGLLESRVDLEDYTTGAYAFLPSWRPIVTRRQYLHKVVSVGRSWVLTFRGPWARTWKEVTPKGPRTLASGRVEVSSAP